MEDLLNGISTEFLHRMPFGELFKDWNISKAGAEERLEYLMYAAYCAYFDKKDATAKQFLNILTKEEFEGNHDKWTWTEGAILLQIHLDNYANHRLKEKLKATLDYAESEAVRNICRKAFQRRAKGFLLNKREFPFPEEDKRVDFLKVIPYFSELIFIRTFNESDLTDEQLSLKMSLIEDKITQIISSYK